MKFSPETHRRRDGIPFRVLAEDVGNDNFPVVIASPSLSNQWTIIRLTKEGKHLRNYESGTDLIPISQVIKVPKLYLYIYEHQGLLSYHVNDKQYIDTDAKGMKEIEPFEIIKIIS